jgi:HEAT repeat protein
LIEALKDRDVDARGSAVYALGEIGPAARAAISALGVLLKDDNADIRKAAALALGKITDGDGE